MKFGLSGLDSLFDVINELMTGLSKLTLTDNFESFEIKNKVIKAGATANFPNALTVTPSKYIITSQIGGSLVAKSASDAWSKSSISLKNYGTEDVTVSVIFMK